MVDGPVRRTYVEAMTQDPLADHPNAEPDDVQSAARRPGRLRAVSMLARRWPTAIALALAAPDLFDGPLEDPDGAAETFGQALPILPLAYMVMVKLGRRNLTWPVVFTALAAVAAVRFFDLIAPSTMLIGASLVVLLWGAIDGQLQRSGEFKLQTLGLLIFGGLALVGLAVDADLGRYLIAAGWFFHGVWDFVHLWRDKVVARSFAEWCGVIDIMIAAQLVLLF